LPSGQDIRKKIEETLDRSGGQMRTFHCVPFLELQFWSKIKEKKIREQLDFFISSHQCKCKRFGASLDNSFKKDRGKVK
jgi:hypothetical protein